MSVKDSFDITVRQVGTTEKSATAMLDTATERRLYLLYRDFFRASENERNWNLWTEIPWDEATATPSPELVAGVFAAYGEDIFLPDYSAKSLQILRASRGRAWFWTRWSYEEGKHILTWTEWLTRTGAYTDDALRAYAAEQLAAFRWEPNVPDAPGIFWDTLLWEQREIGRTEKLLALANSAGDTVLTRALTLILGDEKAHLSFLQDSINIIRDSHPELILTSAEQVAHANELPDGVEKMIASLTA